MNAFTVRFAHLEKIPDIAVSDIVKRGDIIGRMGNTGLSTAKHLHIDIVRGYMRLLYHLSDIRFDTETIKQLGYFIDHELFNYEIVITAYFGDPAYISKGKWKFHPAYDVVPENRHMEPGRNSDIFWNRTPEGVVLSKGFDIGYGNHIMIGFEA